MSKPEGIDPTRTGTDVQRGDLFGKGVLDPKLAALRTNAGVRRLLLDVINLDTTAADTNLSGPRK